MNDDQRLAQALGEWTGKISEIMAEVVDDGVSAKAAKWSGVFGAKIAAHYMPTERHRIELAVADPAEQVLALATAFLKSEGKMIDEKELDPSPHPMIAGVIGSGWLKMNPTLLYVEILHAEADNCTVALTAAAKEGVMLKQQSAEKAVVRLAQRLRGVLLAA